MAKYQDIRKSLKTGDIVLSSGKGGISTAIKWVTKSKWSHIGMVLRIPDYEMVLVWEATTLSNIADVRAGKARKGEQLVPLRERINKYVGEAVIRQLSVGNAGQSWKLTTAQTKNLAKLRSKFKGRPYEKSQRELLRAAYDGPWGDNVEDFSSLFCSELVAAAYQTLGFLGGQLPANEFTPADFRSGSLVDNNLIGGATLGKEIPVFG